MVYEIRCLEGCPISADSAAGTLTGRGQHPACSSAGGGEGPRAEVDWLVMFWEHLLNNELYLEGIAPLLKIILTVFVTVVFFCC